MCGRIRVAERAKQGWTLVEVMVAVALFTLGSASLMGLYIFSVKTMASMYSYCELDQRNRQAMDQLTREIRQSRWVKRYTTNSITVVAPREDLSGDHEVTYSFSPSSKKMLRSCSD